MNRFTSVRGRLLTGMGLLLALLIVFTVGGVVSLRTGVRLAEEQITQLMPGGRTPEQARVVLRQDATRRERAAWLLCAAALVIGGGIAWTVVRSLDGPLDRLSERARRLADGDMSPGDMDGLPTELGRVSMALSRLAARQRGVVSQAHTEWRQIRTAAEDLSAVRDDLMAASTEIRRATEAIGIGTERQVDAIRRADGVLRDWHEAAARDATSMARVLADGAQLTALGEQQLRDQTETAATLTALRLQVQRASGETRDLAREADALLRLENLVQDLVAQSDVLAINARVEAARAEDPGFTAIAEEARRLADAGRSRMTGIRDETARLQEQVGRLANTWQDVTTLVLALEAVGERTSAASREVARASIALRETAVTIAQSGAEGRRLAQHLGALREELELEARATGRAAGSVSTAASEQEAATEELAGATSKLLQASEGLERSLQGFSV